MGSSASTRNIKKPIRKFRGASKWISSLKARNVSKQIQSEKNDSTSKGDHSDSRIEGIITDTNAAWAALRKGQTIDMTTLPRSDIAAFNQQEPLEENGYTETRLRDVPSNVDTTVENEENCSICNQFTFSNLYACRVCTRVFHIKCLRSSGRCRNDATMVQVENVLTNSGWSCQYCDDLAVLLTEEELLMLTSIFDQCDSNQDTVVTLDEYVTYKRELFKSRYGCDLPKPEEEDEIFRFRHMSDKNGDCVSITWSTFLNYEAIKVLEKRDEKDLVKLLTEKEIQIARETFRFLDRDGNGAISHVEATEAFGIWYRNFYKDSSDKTSALDSHIKINARLLMEADANNDGIVTWPEYLENHALYQLAARPNPKPPKGH